MSPTEILATNLLSPVVLAFGLGVLATLLKSDLEFPEPLYQALSIYLLLAIGLKGGAALSVTPLGEFLVPAGMTILLGLVTPLTAFAFLKAVLRMDRVNAGALAAHYGSVSAVTFLAAVTFGEATGVTSEGFMPALVALLEVPAIVVGLLLARGAHARPGEGEGSGSWAAALHEVVTGKSIFLLVGGVALGWAAGKERMAPVDPFFVAGFQGALTLFLLEMGLVASRRLRDLREAGILLVAFGTFVPLVHGVLGVWAGSLAGLSTGGSAVLGTMVASASYIAAPAAVRIALPEAKPSLYLTASLGITFPFNLVLGIPVYFALARIMGG
ncbi:MAG TPA: sodium-dependent bicarbonate transport family permease [Longimicrobiales bacterium]|nr:sodium-dependent bicarbonate transport family permease [Longimicrobiales bacterium]